MKTLCAPSVFKRHTTLSKSTFNRPQRKRPTSTDLDDILKQDAEAWIEMALGQPHRIEGNEWRYEDRKFSINISNLLWRNYASGETGHLISLLADNQNCTVREMVVDITSGKVVIR